MTDPRVALQNLLLAVLAGICLIATAANTPTRAQRFDHHSAVAESVSISETLFLASEIGSDLEPEVDALRSSVFWTNVVAFSAVISLVFSAIVVVCVAFRRRAIRQVNRRNE
jgi:hypothetical protein